MSTTVRAWKFDFAFLLCGTEVNFGRAWRYYTDKSKWTNHLLAGIIQF